MWRALMVVLILGLVPAALDGCASSAPPSHGALTLREFAVADAIARDEAKTHFTTVVSATATVGSGTVTGTDVNTGHPCTSGMLLHINVIGDFHGTLNLGGPGFAQHSPGAVDGAFLITADPKTGLACSVGVRYVGATPDPGATVLFTH